MAIHERRIGELLDASFDGNSTEWELLEIARILGDHVDVIDSLVEQAFIHSLLLWNSEAKAKGCLTVNAPVHTPTSQQSKSDQSV